jgi:glutamate dehydrogenase/leucine dehydrogenase
MKAEKGTGFQKLMKGFESRYDVTMKPAREGEKVTKTEAAVALRLLEQGPGTVAEKKAEARDAIGSIIMSDAAEDAVRAFAARGRTGEDATALVKNGHELRALLLADPARFSALARAARGTDVHAAALVPQIEKVRARGDGNFDVTFTLSFRGARKPTTSDVVVVGADGFPAAGPLKQVRRGSGPPSTSVPTQSRSFLTKVVIELTKARDRLKGSLGITAAEWKRVSKPELQASFDFSYRKDDGSLAETTGYRTVFSTIRGAGKGGLRVVPDLDQDTVNALASEMPAKTAIMNAPVGGAKGGFRADAKSLSDGEFARAMRGYVEALMDHGHAQGRLALGPAIDVPAPDVGTSHPRVALMDIAVDAYLGWLAKNGIDKVGDLVVPKELAAVKHDADGLSTPFVDRYLQLQAEGKIANVGLLATFTGKSVAKGGSLGRNDATGLGVALATLEVMKHEGLLSKAAKSFDGESVAVQGYGNVGRGAVLAYADLGAKVTRIAEFDGSAFAIEKADGFSRADVEALDLFRARNGTIRGFPGTATLSMDEFWSAPVDILAPSAREGVITDEVAKKIAAKVVVEGANGPTTHEGDAVLSKRGITVVPDVFANAAGVTVSSYEMEQNLKGERWSLDEVNAKLARDIPLAFARLAEAQKAQGGTLRSAAFDVALGDFVTSLRAKQ